MKTLIFQAQDIGNKHILPDPPGSGKADIFGSALSAEMPCTHHHRTDAVRNETKKPKSLSPKTEQNPASRPPEVTPKNEMVDLVSDILVAEEDDQPPTTFFVGKDDIPAPNDTTPTSVPNKDGHLHRAPVPDDEEPAQPTPVHKPQTTKKPRKKSHRSAENVPDSGTKTVSLALDLRHREFDPSLFFDISVIYDPRQNVRVIDSCWPMQDLPTEINLDKDNRTELICRLHSCPDVDTLANIIAHLEKDGHLDKGVATYSYFLDKIIPFCPLIDISEKRTLIRRIKYKLGRK